MQFSTEYLSTIPEIALDPDGTIKARLDDLTKPRGSLGRIEDLALQICSIKGTLAPGLTPGCVFVMAGDHGVVAEGVSAFLPEVTRQMVLNFAAGGAAINVFARLVNARVIVADVGVATPVECPGVLQCNVRRGTANMARGPAMTRDEAIRAIETGIGLAAAEAGRGMQLAAIGEMGIGNTTPAAAMLAAFTSVDPSAVTGPGTGLDGDGVVRKIEVIRRALTCNRPCADDPLDVLAKVGGLEIGALAGVCLECARRRIPVLIDGFISSAAALLAARLAPRAVGCMIASHLSKEPGHARMIRELGLAPLFDLGLRLGEGTGAALAMHLCDAAGKMIAEMATFSSAGVANKNA